MQVHLLKFIVVKVVGGDLKYKSQNHKIALYSCSLTLNTGLQQTNNLENILEKHITVVAS